MKKTLAPLIIILLLASCHETVVQLKSISPDGKTTVTMNGKKSTAMDPFHVSLHVKSGDIPDGSLEFEITAPNLDNNNVKFDWQNANNCMIRFTQGDGEVRNFALQVSNTNVVMEEVKGN